MSDELRLLLIETSGRSGQVAIAAGPDLLAVRTLDEARRHARDLAPAVAALLREQSWEPRDVQGVIVDRGPGSYTGLRVGLMAAKAFAYAIGCPIIALTSFAAIARQYKGTAARLDVIADAQQEKVYVQSFERNSQGTVVPATDVAIRALADWLATLHSGMAVSGPGLRAYGGRLASRVEIADADQWDPRAETLLGLGVERLGAGHADDVWSLEPLYLRVSSAEERWKNQESGGRGQE